MKPPRLVNASLFSGWPQGTGKRLAVVLVAFGAVGFVICFPTAVKGSKRGPICVTNLKQLALGAMMYQEDFDGRLPLRDSWMDDTLPYVKSEDTLHCTELRGEPDLYGYCFNASLSGVYRPPNPEKLPLIFESVNLARNASGSLDSMPLPGRHGIGSYLVHADGHIKLVKTP